MVIMMTMLMMIITIIIIITITVWRSGLGVTLKSCEVFDICMSFQQYTILTQVVQLCSCL
jgi:hypothetical protein